jgi:hypothetical protein
VQAIVSDDVQVAEVDLLVNGQIVQRDVSFPFNFFAFAPSIGQSGSTFTIQVQAVDTGGNVGLSNVLTIGLMTDTSPLTISRFTPANGSSALEGAQDVQVLFSKPLASGTAVPANFQLQDADGDIITPTNLVLRNSDRLVELTYASLLAGTYNLVINGPAVTDRVGNSLSTGTVTDSFTLTPRETLTVANPDAAPSTPGMQLYEGVTVAGTINVDPSVSVQAIELLLNGQVIATSSTAPLNYSFIAPLLSAGASSFNLQAQVTDTGGFTTTSEPLVVGLLRDTTPPTIVGTDPADGSTENQGLATITITFSKPIAESSVSSSNFQVFEAGPSGVLGGSDEISIPITGFQFLTDDTEIQLAVAPLQAGLYELVLAESGITDRPGNPLGTGTFTSTFTLQPQLIENGGFETGDLTGWTFAPASFGSLLDVDQEIAPHSGNYAADFGATGFEVDSISQTLATITGDSYTISYWLAHDETDSENEFQVSWGGNVIQSLLNASSFDWTNYTFTEVATTSSTVLEFSGYEVPAWYALDDVSVLDNGQPQFLAATTMVPATGSVALSQAQLQLVVTQAIVQLATAGYNVSGLDQVQFQVAPLPGSLLGQTYQRTVWIDPSAHGYGWYINASPSSNAAFTEITGWDEFQAMPNSPAYGHVDLLTVVTHELGHVLGFASIDPGTLGHDWMTATLGTGSRRYPDPARASGPAPAAAASVVTAAARTSDGGTGTIGSRTLEVIASLVPSSGPGVLGPPARRSEAGPSDAATAGLDAIVAPSSLDLVDASLLDPVLGASLDGRRRGFARSNLRREFAYRPRLQRTLSALRPEQIDAFLDHVARPAIVQPMEERRAHFKASRLSIWW